jgi:hypothetical protein
MPGAPFAAFVGGHARSQSAIADCSTLLNLYPEFADTPGSKAPAWLYPTPGFQRFGATAQVGGRAFFSTAASDSRIFSITGMRLYEWLADGSTVERGVVAMDANPGMICTNGDGGQQLGITAGGNFYCYDLLTNVLTQVAFLTGKATMVGFVSGYFVVFDIATGTEYQSDLYDGTVFDPANFFQRSVQADDWVSSFVTSWGQIAIFGTKTRDYYYDAGTFPIPFAPANSGIQTEGCAAAFSVCEVGAQLCWLGTTAQGGYSVYAAGGYESKPISSKAVEFALSRNTQHEIATAVGQTYSDQGHDFYLLTVGNVTWGFDFATGQWHQRRTFVDAVSGQFGAQRARFHCFGFNKHLWLDATTGVAYESDIAFTKDVDDLVIQRQRTSPSICFGNQVLDIGEFELKMQVGIGNPGAAASTDPGINPTILLEISYDGGMTWGRQRAASVGREGDYGLRVRWQSNGSGRDVAFRVTMSDPVNNWRIISAFLEVFDESGRQMPLAKAA